MSDPTPKTPSCSPLFTLLFELAQKAGHCPECERECRQTAEVIMAFASQEERAGLVQVLAEELLMKALASSARSRLPS
jgi:hypothetical protein